MNLRDRYPLTWSRIDLAILAGYVLLTALFALLGYLDRPGARIRGGDSDHYFVYLPALLLHGNLDFGPLLETLGGGDYVFPSSIQGKQGNPFSIGPALLWLPFFLIGHVVALISDIHPPHGLSSPYQAAVYLGNALISASGILFTLRFLRLKGCSKASTLLSVTALMMATQLSYYLWPKSATSHGASFATVALFAWTLVRGGISWKSGLIAGLATLIRWQNILIVAPLAVAEHIAGHGWRLETRDLKRWMIFLGLAIPCLIPQLAVWWVLYGSPIIVPQGQGFLDFSDLALAGVLFSARHGLLLWHPILIVGLIGFIFSYRKQCYWVVAAALAVTFQWIVNAAVDDWWAGWSFGHRRFIGLLPLFTWGVALFYDQARLNIRQIVIAAVVVLSIWNQLFLLQYQFGLIPRNQAPSFTEFVSDKLSPVRVWQTQRHVNTAIAAFRANAFQDYIDQAGKAHHSYPDYRNSRLVYSVAAAVLQNTETAKALFSRWRNEKPGSLVATWGLADSYIKSGRREEAEALFKLNRWGSAGERVVDAIRDGNQDLLDRSFFDHYQAELDSVYVH